MKIPMKIKILSPLHLGSGKGNVIIDAEVVHDEYGVPYFPAKRLRGLLFESALEVYEMSEQSNSNFFSKQALYEVFGKEKSKITLYIHDFFLAEHEAMCKEWEYLQSKYKGVLTSNDVLETYTSIRYQTKIDDSTGTAAEASLHNMRVVNAGLIFEGKMELLGATKEHEMVLMLAAKNLKYAGAKRNRGFGEIKCILENKYEEQIREILK